MTHEEAYAIVKEGIRACNDGTPNTYNPYTVENVLFITGWLQEDLRRALKKVDPIYRAGQERFEGYNDKTTQTS